MRAPVYPVGSPKSGDVTTRPQLRGCEWLSLRDHRADDAEELGRALVVAIGLAREIDAEDRQRTIELRGKYGLSIARAERSDEPCTVPSTDRTSIA